MSDSELSSPDAAEGNLPPTTIENELRDVVKATFRSGKLEDLTVRRIRTAVESSLGLEEGYLKREEWKDRSKSIIEDEVKTHEDGNGADNKPATSPEKKQRKRPSSAESKPLKRRKTGKADANKDSHSDLKSSSNSGNGKVKKTKVVEPSESELSDVETPSNDSVQIDSKTKTEETREPEHGDIGDESSELSDIIDDEPIRKRGKKGDSLKSKPKQGGKKGRPKIEKSLVTDPDEEEIKRLKGWLGQCGIRKMWYKELQPYATPKAKIKHLKDMLADVGMNGRYSKEKAAQIRDARELAADLEAVQAGNKHWGRKPEDEDDEDSRPKRRLAKGLEGLDFLDDDDGEETD